MNKYIKKENSKLSKINLYEENNNNKNIIFKSLRPNDLSIKRNKLLKKEKNWNSENKRLDTFTPLIDSFEFGVPELKINDNFNLIKYTQNAVKKNEIETEDGSEKIGSATRKFENEDDDDEEENKIKNYNLVFKIVNNKDNPKKSNSFLINKKISNINNNYCYNNNYHINNSNNININNNNFFNTLTYNNDKYQFNYINSNTLIENNINNLNYKTKKFNIDNHTKRSSKVLNVKEKEKFHKKKINCGKSVNSILFSSEYKNVIHIIKNLKEKSKMKKREITSDDNSKNSSKDFSKKMKIIMNDNQNNLYFNNKNLTKK